MLRILSPQWSGRIKVPVWLPWLITIVSVLAVLPVVYVGIYNHPCPADDYENSIWTSFWGRQWELYRDWSGRYFNNFLVTLCPLHWYSITWYRIATVGIVASFGLAYMLVLARGINAFTTAPKRVALALGAAGTALLFNNLLSLVEAFFWYASAVTYVLPATAALLLLYLLMRTDRVARPKNADLIMCSILAAAAIGGNETLIVLCDLVVLGGWLYYRRQDREEHRQFYLKLLVVCIVFSAVAILAPGNFARQSVYPRTIAMVLPTWLYFSQKAFFAWITNPFLLLFSAITLLLLGSCPCRTPRINLLAAFLFPLAIILLLTLPAHYALGKAPPPRVMNIVYAFFLLGWAVFLAHLVTYMRSVLKTAGYAVLSQVLAITIIVGLLGSFNTHNLRLANLFIVSKSLVRHIPQAYDAELFDRYQRIRNATTDTLVVPPIQHRNDNVLFIIDIANWKSNGNRYYAQFWGAQMVYVDTTGQRLNTDVKPAGH